MLDDADVVFVFDEDNYDVLRERYPAAMPKTHLLGVLGARPTVAMQDPYGGTRADFRAAYAAIHECLIAAAGPLPACAGASVGGRGLATSDATGRSATPG